MIRAVCDCGTAIELTEAKTVRDIETDRRLMKVCSGTCSRCGLRHFHCTIDLEVYEKTGRPRLEFLDELMSVMV
jgi:hypothetical protein